MPIYEYTCQECGTEFEEIIDMEDRDIPQPCTECQTLTIRGLSMPSFILKGDGWTGKNEKVRREMQDKNRRIIPKQNEIKREAPGVKLVPNVDGERVENWKEAKKLAESKGKVTTTYDQQVRKEASLK